MIHSGRNHFDVVTTVALFTGFQVVTVGFLLAAAGVL
jgi:hypothetical protein